ncbi:hypothetical protein BCR36DRAFT_588545 [Piromyces finnis]|uniref:WD40 repeat-like protein n=1 Tax=Piromyces finnis TaxID=1754191 RepID=A0A1Y1UBG9_9FUNG|nr:hypothetical protein BCR36DRAFT_588545 [Piromyces finnis]|eukprot:ORX34874.1 hypothetical protein BCR36DRAFT_588545 [Piromyces finnis]
MAISSWDNKYYIQTINSININTRIYEVQQNGQTVPKAMITHEGPALLCSWSKDGSKCFSGGVDKIGKYWDLRSQKPVHTLNLPERCYTMDVLFPLMVVGTAEKHIHVYNLQNPSVPFKQLQSPLKWQTRVVSCFSQGRVGIQYIEDKDQSVIEKTQMVYAINAISFHPIYGTFSTAGSDGSFNFWDKDSKQRLKQFPNFNIPITATSFNKNGSIFAYALGYDWSKGHEHNNQNMKTQVFLHATKDEDVKPKNKKR